MIVGPGQRVRAGGQAPALGPGRASTASPGRPTCSCSASAGADPRAAALDLLAQAEHGEDSLVVAVSDDAALARRALARAAGAVPRAPVGRDGAEVLVTAPDLECALAFAEALAPEHLELVGEAAEALAPRITPRRLPVRRRRPATAFGDYVAGSNHTLPTDGAARFASGLNVAPLPAPHGEVHIGDAAAALAQAGVPIAEAEGFPVHAESMAARQNG